MIATFATIAAVCLTLPLFVLALECCLSQLPLRRQVLRNDASIPFRLAIVVPACNEADRIAETIKRIKTQAPDNTHVVVIADNCTDATAAIARSAGAIVWQRDEPTRRGKGYALNFAWERMKDSPPDVVVFMDADCEPGPNCIATIAQLAYERCRPVQAGYTMHAQTGGAALNSVSALAVYVKNVVRPRGLQFLRLPCLLTGSAMAFPAAALATVRHPDDHIVEDLRASSEFALAGFAPMPCMEVSVSSPLPFERSGFMSQRTRWEHGHMRTILTEVPRLLVRSLRTASPSLLALALELSVPPLSLLVGLTTVSLLLLAGFAMETNNWLPFICLSAGAAFAASGIALVWVREGREILPGKMLAAQIPRYISVKAPLYLRFLARPQTDWVRTERSRPATATADGPPKPHTGNFPAADLRERTPADV